MSKTSWFQLLRHKHFCLSLSFLMMICEMKSLWVLDSLLDPESKLKMSLLSHLKLKGRKMLWQLGCCFIQSKTIAVNSLSVTVRWWSDLSEEAREIYVWSWAQRSHSCESACQRWNSKTSAWAWTLLLLKGLYVSRASTYCKYRSNTVPISGTSQHVYYWWIIVILRASVFSRKFLETDSDWAICPNYERKQRWQQALEDCQNTVGAKTRLFVVEKLNILKVLL